MKAIVSFILVTPLIALRKKIEKDDILIMIVVYFVLLPFSILVKY